MKIMWKKFNILKLFYSINRSKYPDQTFEINNQSYSLRKLSDQQVDELLKLQDVVYKEFKPWTREIFLNELRNRHSLYVGVYLFDDLIGFAGINVESMYETHITNLSVISNYRNNGIGSFLIQKMIDFSRNEKFSVLSLEVDESNLNAIRLYEKFNFKKIRYVNNYYPEHHGAVIMEKVL